MKRERGERTIERGFENFCFTLSGIPGSASISDPSSDPPPSGLTAMASKCQTRKQVGAGGKVRYHVLERENHIPITSSPATHFET